MIGQVIGHYRVTDKIAEGGMGVVYRAHDEVLNRDVALKVLADSPLIESLGKDHLLHEARACSALNHPNICTIYEVIDVDGTLYIAMELVEGKSLAALIGETGLPVESVLRYGGQIAGALAHAHGRRIVHHDLKGSNIVVTLEGLVKVLDFGLARRIPAEASIDQTMTFRTPSSPGEVSGTLFYMAPEVLRGEPGDARSDLWALGVVLYEAAAGQLPFRGKTAFEVSSSILHEMPAALPARIPPGLWAIIQRSLAKQPAERYQQAGEVKAALDAVESSAIAGAQPSSQPTGFRTTVVRGMKHLRVSSGDVLLLVGTTKGAFLLRSTKQRSPHDADCVYVVPVESDEFRCTPDGRLRVYRTRNAGGSWEPLTRGLPQKGAYETVLRDAMAVDTFDPAGVYFGTRSGQIFGSSDDGKTWKRIVAGLPSVVCVKAAVTGEPRAAKPLRPRERTRAASPRSKRPRTQKRARAARGR